MSVVHILPADADLREWDARVDAAEDGGIRARWEYGLALLSRRVGKQLPKGLLDEEVEKTGKSRTELQYRAQFAETYSAEEVSTVVDTFKAWTEIRESFKTPGNYDRNAGGAHEGSELSEGDAEGEGWKLLLGDFRTRLADLPSGSVNLIVTDPPYPEEFLLLWEDLGWEASRLLVEGGVLAARCGHLYLPQVLSMLGGSLQYGWTYAEPLPGSNVRFLGRKIAVAYQPWVAFSNGPWPSGSTDWHPDMLAESPRAKARYVWEQKPTIAAEITATFASVGNDVLDPFAGSGSYGAAALGVGCRWIGVELDPAGHAQAAGRLRGLAP